MVAIRRSQRNSSQVISDNDSVNSEDIVTVSKKRINQFVSEFNRYNDVVKLKVRTKKEPETRLSIVTLKPRANKPKVEKKKSEKTGATTKKMRAVKQKQRTSARKKRAVKSK
jgi:hypothetical protein